MRNPLHSYAADFLLLRGGSGKWIFVIFSGIALIFFMKNAIIVNYT